MKDKKIIGLVSALSALALAADSPALGHIGKNPLRPEDIDVTPKPPVVPKGCKLYKFDDGFETVASSEKSAKRKHEKYLKKSQ